MSLGKMEEAVRWEAVGPFPSGMREHPLVASPLHAFAHKHGDPDIDFALRPFGEGSWPSELPTGGRAGWGEFIEKDGEVTVSYPAVRWKQLRDDHGWASLQYSVFLRRPITIPDTGEKLTRVKVDAFQAVEFAFVSKAKPESPVTWYAGDVYAFGETPSGQPTHNASSGSDRPSNFAREIALKPGDHVLLMRSIYECRMYGDPGDHPPEIKIRLHVYPDYASDTTLGQTIPDVLDGWLMGDWASFDFQCDVLQEQSTKISVHGRSHGIGIRTVEDVEVYPGQTRAVPLLLTQGAPLGRDVQTLDVEAEVTEGGVTRQVKLSLPVNHVSSDDAKPIHMTFASPAVQGRPPALVSGCTVVPPATLTMAPHLPPVLLALHGAGVDYRSDEWIEAMPQIPGMWAVLPSGRTEWGEDWHGGSLLDVWAARDALYPLLLRAGIETSRETVLIGHSNGGQGAWHTAARYPDRIRGVVAVAGYLKIQDYVPYTETTSAHFADPALLGILHASLAPYNNDLYASNLASVPVLAVHGADDDNVPPRHGRSHAAIVAAWAGEANVKFVEVPDVGHVWDGVLRHPSVTEFLTNLPPKRTVDEVRDAGFTLATANPDETSSKGGIRIVELAVPGRLARLDVNAPQWKHDRNGPLDIHGSNVRRIEISGYLDLDSVTSLTWADRQWTPRPPAEARSYGPMIRLLASAGPVTIVIGKSASERHVSLARRYAHDLRVYHRLDSVIVNDKVALHAVAESTLSRGSVVVIGRPEDNQFAAWLIAQQRIPVKFPTRGVFTVDDRLVWETGTGIIALHPHPLGRGLAVLVAGNDELGLELAARLLPLRTGVPVPDWCVVSPRCRWQGAGGLVGAGFWAGDWGWSEGMSWFDRE